MRQIRPFIAILLAGIWINASEFFRNEFLLKAHWVGHFQSLGMAFPSTPTNGALWVTWGFLFAAGLYLLSRRHSLMQTTLIGWLLTFVLMWIVIGNLNVLPLGILPYAIPLSLVETIGAAWICRRVSPP